MTATKSTAHLPVWLTIPWIGILIVGSLPAFAQTGTIETLRAATSELAAGKPTAVIKRLDQAILAGQMSQSNMARALYLRGQAKQSVGRTAEAIADLNSAIWFNKLPAREQKAAIAQRQKAYQKSGITPPAGSSPAPTAASQASIKPTVARPVARTSKPIQHKVARPILSSSRLPDGHQRKLTTPSRPPQQTIARAPTQPDQTQPRQQQARASAPIARQSVPAWSQVVTGTVPTTKSPLPATPKIRPQKPVATAAAIPSFRQITVPSRPPRTTAASAATPVKTWSPLTQQFTSPPPEPTPQSTAQPAAQPKPKPVAVARPVKQSVPAPRTLAAVPQPPPAAPPKRAEQPKPPEKSSGIANIGSLLFGNAAPPKSDAIAAADKLQAERRARIQAHNKQFESQ